MIPTHHPDPDDLASYASGVAPEWMSVVVACHLTYCAECRDEVALLDDLGGALLDTLADPAGAALMAAPPLRAEAPKKAEYLDSPVARTIPRPLHRYFKEPVPTWRFLAPGVKHVPVSLDLT